MQQPPDYSLPGMVPPYPSRSRDTRNPCAICLEHLSGPPEANAELPDTLERMTTCQHQFHRYCCAKHVRGSGANDRKLYCPLCRAAVTADEAQAMITWIDGMEPLPEQVIDAQLPSQTFWHPGIQFGMGIISRVLDALGQKIAATDQPDHWWELAGDGADTREPLLSDQGFQNFLTMLESMLEAEINATLGQGESTPDLTRVGLLRLQAEARIWRGPNGDTLVHAAVRANKPEYVLALTLDSGVEDVEGQFVHRNAWTLANDLGESVALLAAVSAVNNAPFTLLYTPPAMGLTTLPVDMLRLVYDVLSEMATPDVYFDDMMDEIPDATSPLYPQTGRTVLVTLGANLDATTRALAEPHQPDSALGLFVFF